MRRAPERVRYVVDPVWRVLEQETFLSAWTTLRSEARACGFVGLDLEWTTVEVEPESDATDAERARRRNPKRLTGPVATVQLSSNTVSFVIKHCDLWHLVNGATDQESGWEGDPHAACSSTWPNHRVGEKHNTQESLAHVLREVLDFLQDDTVAKVGVGIAGDMIKFQHDYPDKSICPCVDLVTLANHYIHKPLRVRLRGSDFVARCPDGDASTDTVEVSVAEVRSLKEMSVAFCGRPLAKDLSVVMSDWGGSLGALSPMQIHYAAGDAEASFDACVGIIDTALAQGLTNSAALLCGGNSANRLEMLRPLFLLPGRQAPPTSDESGPKRKTVTKTLTQRLKEWENDGATDPDEVPDVGWCKGRAKRYYDNINVYDPSMKLVFTVDQSKAEWYVHKKKIAEVVEWRDAGDEARENGEEVKKREMAGIQLSFTPDFRKFNDAHIRRNLEYFQQPKENVCVVCGDDSSLVRFAVIPMMYRKYFPSVYMSHNSYDLLLLCTACFAKSRAVHEAERQSVSRDFGIPLTHLTPGRLELFEKEIAAAEEEALRTAPAAPDTSEADDLVAHHLSGELRLKVMKEFAAMERHHDCMVTILKYAKALHGHYITTGVDSGPSVAGERRFSIPERRVALLRAFVDAEAPRYYFSGDSSPPGYTAEAPGFPSSPEGVRWILCGRSEGSSAGENADEADGEGTEDRSPGSSRLRACLTSFWLRENPQLAAYVPRTVRAEEKSEPPMVDSHGFFVVRMLMEKYADDSASAKNGEHAIGQFIYRWRCAFLEKLQPKHLPNGWLAEDGILR